MKYFDSVLDVIFGNSRERELERHVARLTAENSELKMIRNDLRRHLQNIRRAHEPLHAAIFPPEVGGQK